MLQNASLTLRPVCSIIQGFLDSAISAVVIPKTPKTLLDLVWSQHL